MNAFFAKATPEEIGICSQNVIEFLDKLAEKDVCMHSVLLVRYGKLAVETYYAPYTADTLHRMFSVTKSFISLAIGLLEAEGKLSLDDRIVDHFPEKLPNKVHPYIAQITIRDMLMMATAHARTTYKRTPDPDWVKSFFVVEPTHRPGMLFSYDTSSSHTLGALVEKLTKMSVLDYLRTQFLDDIHFSKNAYIITDPMGVSMAGSGLVTTPLDLAKVAWIAMNEGNYNGKQYLPQDYIKAAVKKQITTMSKGNNLDEQRGYGYQFWQIQNNGFGMLGMGGQLALCFPEKNLLLVTTADTQDNSSGVPVILDSFFEFIFDNLSDNPLPENPDKQVELEKRVATCEIKPLRGIDNTDFVAKCIADVDEREYLFEDNSMGLRSIKLSFFEGSEVVEGVSGLETLNAGTLYFTNQSGSHVLKFGIERIVVSQFPHYNYRCATSGAWAASDTFVIKSNIIDYELGMVTIRLAFKEDAVTVAMKKVMETGLNEFSGIASGRIRE